LRYIYQSDLVPQNCTAPCSPSTGLDGQPIVAAGSPFANTNGFSNISSNFQTIFDAFKRKAFSTDVSYSVSKWGQHTFKFGYGFNRLANDLLQGFNSSQTLISWGQSYTPGTTEGQTNCAQIITQNQATYGSGA